MKIISLKILLSGKICVYIDEGDISDTIGDVQYALNNMGLAANRVAEIIDCLHKVFGQ